MAEKTLNLTLEYLSESIRKLFSNSVDADKKTIGLELELIPLKKLADGRDLPVEITSPDGSGICDQIRKQSADSKEVFDTVKEDGTPQFSTMDGGNITFEPGGQVEYSTSQGETLGETIKETVKYVDLIHRTFNRENIWLFFGAINPWYDVDQVGLKIQKPRYRAMDKYFASIGPYGQQMMRLTASLQVNLDLGDPETMQRRWLASNLLSPVVCALFANSPFFQARPAGVKSYRAKIWQNLDGTRTGFPHLNQENERERDSVQHYLNYALNAKIVGLPDSFGNFGFRKNDVSFLQWMNSGFNGFYPDQNDWHLHLSTLFPEVRPKGFFEFRTIDGQARAWWAVPAVLLTSILYDSTATEQVIDLLSPRYKELDKMGRKASISGVGAFPDTAKKVFEIGLNAREFQIESDLMNHCEQFYKRYTFQELTPADDLLKLNDGQVFSSAKYLELESRLLDVAELPEYAAFQSPALENEDADFYPSSNMPTGQYRNKPKEGNCWRCC
ncbi:MAG: hypothetical protein GY866_29320 [Proteobacteria bacterium]|nr:hypothetical protein [Pseudomonadota bacterium]